MSEQPPDQILADLSQAREQYEDALADVRREVLRILADRKAALQSKAKPNIDHLKKLEAEQAAFEQSGQWPGGIGIAPLQARFNNATKLLHTAYESAKSAYARSNLRAAEAISEDLRSLRNENDLAPWGGNAVAAMPAGARMATADGPRIAIARCDAPHYRVQIRAKRIDGDGPLVIELPLPDGKRITVRALPQKGSDLRAMLAVRAGAASAELGIGQPVDLSAAVKDESDKLSLGAEKGRYQVESIAFKPIQAAAAEKKPADRKPAAKPAGEARPKRNEPAGLQQLMPIGSRWQGIRTKEIGTGDTQVDGVVKEHIGTDEVRMKIEGSADFDMTWTFKGTGKQVVIASFRELQGGKGRRSNVGGAGQCDGKSLIVSYEWTLATRKKKNQLVRGTLSMQRKK